MSASTRYSIYAILIAISAGLMLARIARVRSPDPKNRTPFLSANDRSRWATIRALGDDNTYSIDHIVFDAKGDRVRGWHTIDMVRHRGRDGREHYYSSKPTLLTTLLAGEYWLLKSATGATLTTQTFFVARIMLVLTNVVPLVIGLALVAWLVERVGWASSTPAAPLDGLVGTAHPTDFTFIFVVAAACYATFLTTFSVTLNNHLIAGVSLILGLAVIVPMWQAGRFDWLRMTLAGFCLGFLAANELPALSLTVFSGLALAWKAPLKTLLAYVPATLAVAAAALGTNIVAHGDWRTPYAHRQDGPVVGWMHEREAAVLDADKLSPSFRDSFQVQLGLNLDRTGVVEVTSRGARWNVTETESQQRFTLVRVATNNAEHKLEIREWANWYDYPGSYWTAEKLEGVDRGESSPARYAFNVLIGHHGLFSLTPIWLLSAAGSLLWLRRWPTASGRRKPPGDAVSPSDPAQTDAAQVQFLLAVTTLVITLVVVAFYLTRPQIDRNYGGGTCCLRWLIWFTPLWLLTMLPAADWLSRSWTGRGVLIALLAVSVFSAHYAADNPWSHPWIFDYWTALGWIKY